MRILAINPGSTSTKLALFEDEVSLWEETTRYEASELAGFERIADQEEFRYERIKETLAAKGEDLSSIDAFVARGGLLRPIEGGTYRVSQLMQREMRNAKWGEHASNLASLIAARLAGEDKPAFIVDPVVVDELSDVARVGGVPELPRRSIWHALNQKAVVRRAARSRGGKPQDYNFICCHMGGGVSVAAHRKGCAVEVNNALGGEGPMSPERAGTVQALQLVDLCYSGEYTQDEICKKLVGKGGFVGHLATNDFREVTARAATDPRVKLVRDAFVYQLGRSIGGCAVVLEGRVDAILLTGGLAYDTELCNDVRRISGFLAPIEIYPGEDEMVALVEGALRVLRNEEEAKEYS